MATVQAPSAPSAPQGPSRPPRHRNRRGRGGNRGGSALELVPSQIVGAADSTPAGNSAPVAPQFGEGRPPQRPANRGNGRRGNRGGPANSVQQHPTEGQNTSPTANPESQPQGRQQHGDRGGRRGNRGRGDRGGSHMMMNGRAFGGNLTTATSASAEGSLAGDAPAFVPGRPLTQRTRGQGPRLPNPPRARRLSKSQAPDIATRTHEDIRNGQYECVICTNEVLPNSRVWNCKTCWSVLHLSCVKKWSKNEVSTHQQRATENGELPPPRQWRCPGCNLPKEKLPDDYTCWCEKEVDPKSVPGLPPHSCGQSCSKPRIGKCPHPCELICHAGPCPPCSHMGPQISCFCGKEMVSKRCIDTNYDAGWSCNQICDDELFCNGNHKCPRPCHEGVCGGCEIMIESKCYCGKVEQPIPCSEREDEMESQSTEGSWIGSFHCGKASKIPYDCGNVDHFLETGCRVQDLDPLHCPFSPDVVSHCPCGKTSLGVLLPEPRKDCSDPIPHCKEKCAKVIAECGHSCQKQCHGGDCGSCLEKILITCRCGRTTSNSVCHQGMEEPPCCSRVCRSAMNCGRHECSERCCSGEKKASERQVSKRKHRAIDSARPSEENIEAEHICVRVCGRPLKCGNHFCLDLCHKGPCRSCLEAVFEEVSCACGKTVLQPPQPCGVKPPECRFDCTRQRNCGHPQIKHQCHEDTEACPKCPFLVEKPCVCGKKTLKNQPCWFNETRCGLPCGKVLKCGIHKCLLLCHRDGACEDAAAPCSQACGRQKTVCDHSCSDKCHAPYPCKEQTPCQAKTFITCPCQHQKQAIKCLASKTSEGNTKQVLECNEECLKLQRNAKLAAALNIDPASHENDHLPYSSTTLALFSESTKFAQQYEREFRVFAADEKEKRLRFKPMQAHQRSFIHSLAEDFGFDSESQDPEPHRHVSIFKTPKFVSAPLKTLGQCVKAKAAVLVEATPAKSLASNMEPWNAILLSDPRFGLTIDELHADLAPEFTAAGLEFEVSFLPSGDCVLRAISSGSWLQKLDTMLLNIKPAVSRKVSASKLASAATLCAVDSSLNVLRKEEQGNGIGGGWSQVAKGGSGVKRVVEREVGRKSSFTVLGKVKKEVGEVKGKGKEKAKEKEKEEVTEDWEKEVEGWGDV